MTSAATIDDLRKALRARDRAGINLVAERLLEQRSRLGEEWFSVAHVLVRNGEVTLALSAANRGVEECGGSPKARFQLAHILSIVGRQSEAIAIVSDLEPHQVSPVQLDHFLGTCAMEVGDFELARDAFERVLAAAPASAPTWLSLAALPPTDDSLLLDRLSAASPALKSPPDARAQWHYARGTVLDRIGETDQAFAEFAAGAELVRPTMPYDAGADLGEVAWLTSGFTATAISDIAQQVQAPTDLPIFVTGLPRSGTTLVEQILTGHSKVAGGGEMPFASIVTREIGGTGLEPLQSASSHDAVDRLARLYLHLGAEYFGHGQRFVDKWLGASRTLGVLASVLPESRIIWLRRDPVDCAWSCFRTYFTQRIDWSWSLRDIAAHFRAEDELYAHWHGVLGERLLTVDYEELVAEPTVQTKLMLAHLGLDPEPVLDTAPDNRRAVTTASITQVRQPVYRTSVGSADRYRHHLQPFIQAYAAPASLA